MKRIEQSDVKLGADYESIRPQFRARVIREKEQRRVQVGDAVSLHFENRDTVLFQVQEMVRIEHITESDKVQHEIDTYNQLLPEKGELSATLFIEVTDADQIKPMLDRLQGIDRGRKVFVRFDGQRVAGVFEAGYSTDVKLSAVHYVRFPFTPAQMERFAAAQDVAVVIEHPRCKAEARVPPRTHAALIADLAAR